MKYRTSIYFLVVLFIASSTPTLLLAQNPEPPDQGAGWQFMLGGGKRAWLGVELTDVTAENVSELKLPGEYGAIVKRVLENSPAAKAGLKANDVILEFAGTRVWSVAQLQELVRETPPGRAVTLRVSRNGKRLDLKVSVQAREEHGFTSSISIPRINIPAFSFRFGPMQSRLGVRIEDLTPQLATYFGVKQGKGVLVMEVEAGGPAAKAGLKAGDCIVQVDSTTVASVSDLMRALDHPGAEGRQVTLTFVRNRHEESAGVKLQPLWPAVPGQRVRIEQRAIEQQIQNFQWQLPTLQDLQMRLQRLSVRQTLV